jgi:hypothetical protein
MKLLSAKSEFSEHTSGLWSISFTFFTLCSLTWPQKPQKEQVSIKEKTKSQKFASCIKLTKPFITGKTAQIEIV